MALSSAEANCFYLVFTSGFLLICVFYTYAIVWEKRAIIISLTRRNREKGLIIISLTRRKSVAIVFTGRGNVVYTAKNAQPVQA